MEYSTDTILETNSEPSAPTLNMNSELSASVLEINTDKKDLTLENNQISLWRMEEIIESTDFIKYHEHITDAIPDVLSDLLSDNEYDKIHESFSSSNIIGEDGPIQVAEKIIKRRYAPMCAAMLKLMCHDMINEIKNHTDNA